MTSIRQTALLSRPRVLLYVLHPVLHIKAPFYRQVRRERGRRGREPTNVVVVTKEEEKGNTSLVAAAYSSAIQANHRGC